MDECTMIDLDTLRTLMSLTGYYIGGLLLGYAYFKALRLTTDLIVSKRQPLLGVALTIGRVGLICTGFYVAAQTGALALLVALTGVLSTKALTLLHIRRSGA
jgi:F1F0 ATPase subunit 2